MGRNPVSLLKGDIRQGRRRTRNGVGRRQVDMEGRLQIALQNANSAEPDRKKHS
jgi:hypothetical protein